MPKNFEAVTSSGDAEPPNASITTASASWQAIVAAVGPRAERPDVQDDGADVERADQPAADRDMQRRLPQPRRARRTRPGRRRDPPAPRRDAERHERGLHPAESAQR